VEAHDHRWRQCLQVGFLVTLLWAGVSFAPGLWEILGSAGVLVGSGFMIGIVAALLLLIAPALAVARKRDTS
jgi:hypothetical protein